MWFYKAADGQEVGPVSGLDMVQLIADGAITETCLVRRDKSSQWREAWQTDRAGYLLHHDRQAAYQQAIRPAPLWRRLIAYVIDIGCYGLLGYGAVMLIMAGVWGEVRTNWLLVFAIWLFVPVLITVFYFIASLMSHHQASPGMRIMGMHVARLEGGRIGFLRSFGRVSVFFLSLALPFLLLVPLFNDRRRMVHDFAVSTMVAEGAFPDPR